ncbi:MAG: aminoacyl-tRNA hydrolase [Puniceicoccales bacterium]|jgi:PTH1 family peptidyl-tRNA hydrolase|nr:aminoacyl-tRNA hydrolase [Puniceicoccales bacterium]
MPFRLVVGLGNPGKLYENTRHNIGFRSVDYFTQNFAEGSWRYERAMEASIFSLPQEEGRLLFAKSSNFMNLSGISVAKICSFFKIPSAQVVVISDDVTLDLSRVKITERPGSAGHNGVKSILAKIGPGLVRFRIGIGRKHSSETALADHVLGIFDAQEEEILCKKMPCIARALKLLLDKGTLNAMNEVNRSLCEQNLTEQP